MMLPFAEDDEKTEAIARISAPVTCKFEPVGRWFEAFVNRRKRNSSLSQSKSESGLFQSSSEDESEEEVLSSDSEDDETFLMLLDPTKWKEQDHYNVLGLGKLRYRATEDDIKKSYKKKVLKYHPDKNRLSEEDKIKYKDCFSCITKAYEILSNPIKRRAYNSVDPLFDNSVPSVKDYNKSHFLEVFGPVFELNERWTSVRHIPKIGDENSTIEEIDAFYTFWYNFDSWREFSYLDEEEKEKGENRDERRWIEKQNKAERQKRKKEETARIRSLVDNAYACDSRLRRLKEEEKERKLAEKRAKEESAKEKERLRLQALEEERLAKEKEENEAREKAQAARKEKERIKALYKKERKGVRTACKSHGYFVEDEPSRVEQMQLIDKLLEIMTLENIQEFRQVLTGNEKEEAKTMYEEKINFVKEEIRKQKEKEAEAQKNAEKMASKGSEKDTSSGDWSEEEMQILIKAVNLFPAGTTSRWEVISEYLAAHVKSGSNKTPRQIINKVKSLKKMDPSMKEEVNKKAFEKFEKAHAGGQATDKPSTRDDILVVKERPWTSEEQQLLEQYLKKIPASTPERWDRIAEAVPTRTKRECMKRYKDLAEMIKAKKIAAEAQARAAAAAKKS